jgi:hypothetical protein
MAISAYITTPPVLSIVRQDTTPDTLLFVKGGERQRVMVAEADVSMPLISLDVLDLATVTGLVERTGSAYDGLIHTALQFVWRGGLRRIEGALVTALTGPDVILPLGYLDGLD